MIKIYLPLLTGYVVAVKKDGNKVKVRFKGDAGRIFEIICNPNAIKYLLGVIKSKLNKDATYLFNKKVSLVLV